MDKIKEALEQHKKLTLIVLVVLALVVIWYLTKKAENFNNFAVDMVAAQNSDPINFKYTGRIRDPSGRDEYDYFYENNLYWKQGVAKELSGDARFAPRVMPIYPGITPSARTGFEKAAENDTFRDSSLAWAQARKELKESQVAPVTRSEIEAKALDAESSAASAALGDNSSEVPGADALTEKLIGRW